MRSMPNMTTTTFSAAIMVEYLRCMPKFLSVSFAIRTMLQTKVGWPQGPCHPCHCHFAPWIKSAGAGTAGGGGGAWCWRWHSWWGWWCLCWRWHSWWGRCGGGAGAGIAGGGGGGGGAGTGTITTIGAVHHYLDRCWRWWCWHCRSLWSCHLQENNDLKENKYDTKG